jgi:hypothetical protein
LTTVTVTVTDKKKQTSMVGELQTRSRIVC